MSETDETRLRRLRMRSWRRGIREMDLILGPFADEELAGMEAGQLALYEALLDEDDQSLYAWVSGRLAPPERFAPLVSRLSLRHAPAPRGA